MSAHLDRLRDCEYKGQQIDHVLDNTTEDEQPFKIKIESESYATKWLNITEAELAAIRALLTTMEDE